MRFIDSYAASPSVLAVQQPEVEYIVPTIIKRESNPISAEQVKNAAKLTTALATFGFQQSPGNEMARTYLGISLLDASHNPGLAALGVGVATVAIEGISGLSTSVALNSNSAAYERLKAKLKRRSSVESDSSKTDRANDIALALALGTSIVVAKKHFQYEGRTLKDDRRTMAKAVGLISTTSAGIAFLAAGGVEYADEVGLGDQAEIAVNYALDWKTYAVMFGVIQVGSFMHRKFKRSNIKQ